VSDQRPTTGKTSALLGDLESIRSLLEEAEAGERPQAEPDDEVPLLEDVVQGGVSINEAFLAGEVFEDTGNASGLNDVIFDALMSDQWRETAREVLDAAHRAIDAPEGAWTSDGGDERNAAIMACIDETLQRWLRQAVLNGMDDLRRELLTAVRSHFAEPSVATQPNETATDEDLDGA
jgi:hypothetical protein